MKDELTIGEKYSPAMSIQSQAEAEAYFEECVQQNLRTSSHNRKQAEEIERYNLGYWAGYYDRETRLRVEELFACEHPILGKQSAHDWTPDAILGKGMLLGLKHWRS